MGTDFDKIQDIPPGELDLNQPETQSVIDDTIRVSRQTTEAVNAVEDRIDTAEEDIDELERITQAATQEEMEAGTEEDRRVTPENLKHSFLVPKIICSITANVGAYTLNTDDSYGVSSVTDLGAANIRINFETDFANTNYVVGGQAGQGNASGDYMLLQVTARNVSYVELTFVIAATGGTDDISDNVDVIIFGDQ